MNRNPSAVSGDCPARDALIAFSVGRLAGADRETLAEHVVGCARCLTILEAIDDRADPVLVDLRRPVPPEPFAEAAQSAVQRLVEQLGDLSASTALALGDRPTVRLEPGPWGDYQLQEKLGHGGMGTVYRARHLRLGKTVAVKVLALERLDDPRALARFQREMKALGALEHPNIVQAHDAREENGVPFLVMEYVEGLDLARLVERLGPLPVADACEVIRQAALGLQYAHEKQGIVHRDVKPANLMVTPEGCVKVLDLGLARFQPKIAEDVAAKVRAGSSDDIRMGTVDYMAPEQWLDAHVDIRADVYSLGCTLCHLLTGEPPFAGTDYATAGKKMLAHAQAPLPAVRSRRPEVPAGLAALLDQMLAKPPEGRPATPAAVAEALRPFTQGCDLARLLASSSRLPAARAPSPPQRRHAVTRWLVAAALAVAALGALVTWSISWFTDLSGPVAITALRVDHWSGEPARHYLGVLGATAPTPQFGDCVRVEIQLNRPGYCYLIVYKPDGQDELVYPRQPTGKRKLVTYPQALNDAYCLNDGTGMQALILIAARQPLPPYADWRRSVGKDCWVQSPTGVAWSFDGRDFEALDGRPRSEQPLHVRPEPFVKVCQELKSCPGVEAIRGIAFPVQPQQVGRDAAKAK